MSGSRANLTVTGPGPAVGSPTEAEGGLKALAPTERHSQPLGDGA